MYGTTSKGLIATLVVAAVAIVGGALVVFNPGARSILVSVADTEIDDTGTLDDEFANRPHGASGLLGIPGTRIRVDPLTLGDERDLGAPVAEAVSSSYGVADASHAATQVMLEELLAAMAPDDGRQYTVTLLDSERVNAFAVIGGTIFFTTGITDLLDEDELAFVMGHEIAHINCRHTALAFEREALTIVAFEVALGQETSDRWFESAEAELADFLLSPGFSRRDEREADLYSLELLRRAGMSTDGAAEALRVLLSLDSGGPQGVDQLFSSHPPTTARIDAIEAELADS